MQCMLVQLLTETYHNKLYHSCLFIIPSTDVGGEYDSLKLIDPQVCRQCIESNPDMIVGVKVRLRADACAAGKNEDDAFR